MGPKTEELVSVLDELICLLGSDNETHWSGWMSKAKGLILESDLSGVKLVLGAFGGMGSFNDLIIGQSIENGKLVWISDAELKNQRLRSLRTKAFELADWLMQNHSLEDP